MGSIIELSRLYLAVAFLTAFGSVFFLLLWLQEMQRIRSIGYAAAKSERIAEEYVKEARGSLVKVLSRRLRRSGYTGDPAPILAGFGFIILTLSAFMAIAGVGDELSLVLSLALSPIVGGLALQLAIARRRRKGARQMLALIRATLLHLESGSSPPQAFARAAEQVGSPLREDVIRALSSKVGSIVLSEALSPVVDLYPSEATDLLLAAVDINDRLGAPLSPALRQAEAILSERQDLAAEAAAELSSSRSEFIGITVAITFIAIMLGRQPAAVQAYLTPVGFLLVALGLANYAIGIIRAVRMFRGAKG